VDKMQQQLAKFKKYQKGPYKLPGATQRAWALVGICEKEEGKPRNYANLDFDLNFPVEYRRAGAKSIQPDQIMVRFDGNGACASDIKIADQGSTHNRMQGRNLSIDPAVMGHEVALTVVKVGEGLKGVYEPGQRFTVNTETILNENKVTFGYKLAGAYREFGIYGRMVLDNDDGCSLIALPEGMSYLTGASLEPYACCFNTLDLHRPDLRTFKEGGNMWFIGAGPMARFLGESMIYRGGLPKNFFVNDITPGRLEKFKQTVGRRLEEAGVNVVYSGSGSPFEEVDAFFQGPTDDAFLMFGAPKRVLEPVVVQALDRMDQEHGVFDIFAGLKEEVVINYKSTDLKLKALHYGSKEVLPSGLRVEGFSGLNRASVEEAVSGVNEGVLRPYETSIAAVASLDRLTNVLHRVEATEIDGKCIVIPHAKRTLGFVAPADLAGKLFEGYEESELTEKARADLETGRFSDEVTMLLFDKFIRV